MKIKELSREELEGIVLKIMGNTMRRIHDMVLTMKDLENNNELSKDRKDDIIRALFTSITSHITIINEYLPLLGGEENQEDMDKIIASYDAVIQQALKDGVIKKDTNEPIDRAE